MQTLLAYALAAAPTAGRVEHGLHRVEGWYGPLWGHAPLRQDAVHDRLAVHLWDRAEPDCRWPAWSSAAGETVVTTHVPLGYQELLGCAALDPAPLALVRRLQVRPRDVFALTGPFVVAHLDRASSTLTLMTDALGLGRLFEVRTPEGRFWSNRPLAALLYAGVRAEVDDTAWRRMAACDWAMGDATPYRGVRTIGAATVVRDGPSGHHECSQDVLTALTESARDPLTCANLDDTADALVMAARSMADLWPARPALSLSGGRDSRLVAAAFVAAGVDVGLRTYGAATGEARTARRLVDALPRGLDHQVTTPSAQRGGAGRGGAFERAVGWHAVTEGLRPALYGRNLAPRALLRHSPPLASGVGGVFAHAPGYPDDVARLERLPAARRRDAFARTLRAKIVLPRGVSATAVADVDRQVRAVLAHAETRGVGDAKALDWFYADERLRRWGMAGESVGKVMPLLTPAFVGASFGLSTTQSAASALHGALIERLVPAWSGIPYYAARLGQRQAVIQQRLWQERDVDVLSAVFAAPASWGDAYDVPLVQAIWSAALRGRAAARDELLLQRVVWRAAFEDHLAAVNGDRPVARAAVAARRPERRSLDLTRAVRAAAVRANDVPLARRVARTPVGRRLRRRLGV